MQVKGAEENSKKKVDETKMAKGEKQSNSLQNKLLAEKNPPKESAGYGSKWCSYVSVKGCKPNLGKSRFGTKLNLYA